jgi:hypothetical protein
MSSEGVQRASPALGQVAPYRWYVFAACTALAVALNYVFGKNMASDLLQYYFYSGFSALNDRFEQDYFAAGLQSYFNPYAYVPFYVLVKSGLPALAVGSVLAVIHSVVLWLTYELACIVCPSEDRKKRFLFGLCATVLAFMNPILLQQIGASFADITTTGLVLGGWLFLVQAVRYPRTTPVVFGAILLGIATALKPTNSIHAFGGFFLVAFVPLPFLGRLRSLFYFGASLGASFVVTAAPWSYRLARTFGNPMFPLLNNVFKTPYITTATSKAYRFIPDSLTDALLRPFAMSGTGGMIHEEMSSPDIRYDLLLLVFLISVIAWIWRSRTHTSISPATPVSVSATRALIALGCGFTAEWIVWLYGSGNSRYFIPMACIAAVLAVALLFRLLANHTLGRNGILLAYGLRVDMSDCETITVRGLRPMAWRPLGSSLPGPVIPSAGKLRYTNYLASCHLVADTSDRSREMAARRAVDVVLNRLEDACPTLFQPPRPQTEHVNQVWQRTYGATDLTAWVGEGEVKFIDPTRDFHEIFVGREEAWAKGLLPIECGRRHGIYFARLLRVGQ